MAPDTIQLEIISSTRVVLQAAIRELYIPAHYGEAGILENHLPYISLLNFGEVSYVDEAGERLSLYIEEGVLEGAANRVQIISDTVQTAEEMDGPAIQREYEAVSRKVKDAVKGEITPEELEAALLEQKKLKVRLDILKKTAK